VKRDFEKRTFVFNHVFKDANNTQQKMFEIIGMPIVESVVNGMNGSILAYGQTGTGKTYTMIGNQDGILPLSVNYILGRNEDDSLHLSISALQIYNEQISDLLLSDPASSKAFPKDMKVKQVMETLHTKEISNIRDARDCFEIAQRSRCVGSTSMNAKSSRSHAIFILTILNKTTDVRSTLYLVDLAGSERIKKSNVSGERIDEAIAINSSLTTLGKCIIALGDKKASHVPFRESKLTKILQDALGGLCKTALILTLSPQIDDLEETISSLLFGQRAKKVTCKPIAQDKIEPRNTLEELKKQLDVKTQLLTEISAENRRLQAEMKELLSDQSCKKDEQIKKLELKMKVMKKEHQTRLEDMDAVMLHQEKEIHKLREKLVASGANHHSNHPSSATIGLQQQTVQMISHIPKEQNDDDSNSDIEEELNVSKKLRFPEGQNSQILGVNIQAQSPTPLQEIGINRLGNKGRANKVAVGKENNSKDTNNMSLEDYLAEELEKSRLKSTSQQSELKVAKAAELEQELASLRNLSAELKSTNSELRTTNSELRSSNTELRKKVKEAEDEAEKFLKANRILIHENEKLQLELKTKQISTATGFSEAKKQPNSPNEKLISSLKSQIQELQDELNMQKEEINYLKEMNQSLEQENQALEEELIGGGGKQSSRNRSDPETDLILKGLKEENEKVKNKLQLANDERILAIEESSRLDREVSRLREVEIRLKREIEELEENRSLPPLPVKNDGLVEKADLDRERNKVSMLEVEVDKWRKRDEEKEFKVESLYNDLAAVEAQLRISKMKIEELSHLNSKHELIIKKLEASNDEKEDKLMHEADRYKRSLSDYTKTTEKEKKSLLDQLSLAENEKRDLENIVQEYRRRESTQYNTDTFEIERAKGLLLDSDNWSTERPKVVTVGQKGQLEAILYSALSKVRDFVRQIRSDPTDPSKQGQNLQGYLNSVLSLPKQSIKKTLTAFLTQAYFNDFERTILSVSSGHNLQETLLKEYIKSRQCLRELATNFETLFNETIETELKLKLETDKSRLAEAKLTRFREVLRDPAFEKMRIEFIKVWIGAIQQHKAACRLQNFFKKIRQQKKMQRLQKRHRSQYELFQAGSGKNLLQMLMKKTEDTLCTIYENIGPIEDDLKQLNKAKKSLKPSAN